MKRYLITFFKFSVLWVTLVCAAYFILPAKTTTQQANVRIGIQTAPRTLNPFLATDASSVRLLQHITPALATFNASFHPVPNIAQTIQTLPHGYRITLRKEQMWHDGRTLKAQDIVHIYTNLQEQTSPYSSLLDSLKGIETVDDHTLVLRVNMADPYAARTLTVPLVRMQADTPQGLGPWKVAQADTLNAITLEHTFTGDQVLFQAIKSPDVRLMALQKGDIDIAHGDISPELFTYGQRKGFVGVSAPSESYTYIGFNTQKGGAAQTEVRKALAYAIDRESLMTHLQKGEAAPALSVFMPTHSAALNLHPVQHNLERAKALLQAQGYGPDKPLTLTLSITNSESAFKLAQVLQNQLKAAHIDLQIQSTEWGTFYENVKKGATEMYILTWVGAFDTDFLNLIYHGDNIPPHGLNRGFYENAQMNTMLDQLIKTPKGGAHNTLAKRIQKQAAEAHIYIPLWRSTHKALTNKRFTHYTMPADGGYPLERLITQ